MNSLARFLYHGGVSGKGYAAQSSSTRPAAASAQEAYNLFSEMTNLPPLIETVPDIPITKMTEMVMVPVQASLRSHYRNCTVSTANSNHDLLTMAYEVVNNYSGSLLNLLLVRWKPESRSRWPERHRSLFQHE
jgi:hypothetical protein